MTTTARAGQPDGGDAAVRSVAHSSATVAAWTLVSRASGLLRVVVIGAVLGPTFLANTFLATNTVPNLTFAAVAGPVLGLVLVPSVVHTLLTRGHAAGQVHIRRLSGLLLVAATAVAGLLTLASPGLAWVLTLGVPKPERGRAWLVAVALLVLVGPQVVLYTVAAVGAAAQQARQRYALAAAASALENVGLMITMAVVALGFAQREDVAGVPVGLVLVLGVGATLSVALHAAVQGVGAARVGLSIRPARGWRSDPEIREIADRLRLGRGHGAAGRRLLRPARRRGHRARRRGGPHDGAHGLHRLDQHRGAGRDHGGAAGDVGGRDRGRPGSLRRLLAAGALVRGDRRGSHPVPGRGVLRGRRRGPGRRPAPGRRAHHRPDRVRRDPRRLATGRGRARGRPRGPLRRPQRPRPPGGRVGRLRAHRGRRGADPAPVPRPPPPGRRVRGRPPRRPGRGRRRRPAGAPRRAPGAGGRRAPAGRPRAGSRGDAAPAGDRPVAHGRRRFSSARRGGPVPVRRAGAGRVRRDPVLAHRPGQEGSGMTALAERPPAGPAPEEG